MKIWSLLGDTDIGRHYMTFAGYRLASDLGLSIGFSFMDSLGWYSYIPTTALGFKVPAQTEETLVQPITVTLASSGSSPWKLVNWHSTPINIGFSAVTQGTSLTPFQIDYTVEDPTFTYKNSSAIYPNSSGVTIFSTYPATSSGYVNFYLGFTTPIAAWRLMVNGSSGGAVALTALQTGIG